MPETPESDDQPQLCEELEALRSWMSEHYTEQRRLLQENHRVLQLLLERQQPEQQHQAASQHHASRAPDPAQSIDFTRRQWNFRQRSMSDDQHRPSQSSTEPILWRGSLVGSGEIVSSKRSASCEPRGEAYKDCGSTTATSSKRPSSCGCEGMYLEPPKRSSVAHTLSVPNSSRSQKKQAFTEVLPHAAEPSLSLSASHRGMDLVSSTWSNPKPEEQNDAMATQEMTASALRRKKFGGVLRDQEAAGHPGQVRDPAWEKTSFSSSKSLNFSSEGLYEEDVMKQSAREEWRCHLESRVMEELERKNARRPTKALSRSMSLHVNAGCGCSSTILNRLSLLLVALVESTSFQWLSGTVTLANVVFIGYTTNEAMVNALDATGKAAPIAEDPAWFDLINTAFTCFYWLELVLRILAYNWNFVIGQERKWNLFDTLLAMLSLVEKIIQDVGVGSLRIIRGLRMFRVLRIIRVVRFFRDLRFMVCSIVQSLGSISWALLLLVIIMYLFSIVLMQATLAYLQGLDAHEQRGHVREGVMLWYSSVLGTMYTLLASIVGGVDWTDVVRPLEPISSLGFRIIFSFYIVFVVIGVLNVLTAISVERASELSGLDRDLVIQSQMKKNEAFLHEMSRIFEEADADESGIITWQEFKTYLENDRVKAYLTTQQLDAFDARTLFDILTENGMEEMSIETFIVGCQHLKGSAKSVDLVAVLQEVRAMSRQVRALSHRLEVGNADYASLRSSVEARSIY